MSDVNVFIMVNLGCEMLYVIDQRLKAQNISLDKAVQVLGDITAVLLDPTFLERLIIGSKQKSILSEEHCKFILNDFACCSLMRLDDSSMSKLWDLITMVFKWQLQMTRYPIQLLEITRRHLKGIAQLHPTARKTSLIDGTKNTLNYFWISLEEPKHVEMYETLKSWFQPLNTKISILMRLGFQNMDGTFNQDAIASHYSEYGGTIGENIYNRNESSRKSGDQAGSSQFKGLAQQLNMAPSTSDGGTCPAMATLYFTGDAKAQALSTLIDSADKCEFVLLDTVHNSSSSWENILGASNRMSVEALLNSKLP